MKKNFHLLLPALFLLLFSRPASAQDELIEWTWVGKKTFVDLFFIFGQAADYEVNMYKITYKTTDLNNNPDTASGLITIPIVPDSVLLPVVFYAHGTTSGPEDVPSRLRGGYEVALGYAASGFATFAPDFLGLGDSRGFHPYLHAASEASSSLDMLIAGYTFLEFYSNDPDPAYLFLAGYSQGGHVAMALHQQLEEIWSFVFPVTASTHMSGPYSLSDVMKEKILSDDIYLFPAYVSYIFLGFNEAYDLYADINEVFKEPYASHIESFYNEEITLTELNATLLTELNSTGAAIPKRMLQDSIIDGLANDPNHPLNIWLAENDTYNFAPSTPTRMYYCEADDQVPFQNALVAEEGMVALGSTVAEAVSIDPDLTHGQCVVPSIISSIEFFKSFLGTTAVNDAQKIKPLSVYPNPAKDDVVIAWEESLKGFDYKIFNTQGTMVRNGKSETNKIAISELPAGFYLVLCTSGDERRVGRILRQ